MVRIISKPIRILTIRRPLANQRRSAHQPIKIKKTPNRLILLMTCRNQTITKSLIQVRKGRRVFMIEFISHLMEQKMHICTFVFNLTIILIPN